MIQSLEGFISSFLRFFDQQGSSDLEAGANQGRPEHSHSPPKAKAQNRKKTKFLKKSKEPLNLVCEKNVSVAQTLKMAETALVGRIRGKYPSRDLLEN